ncbi:MAG: hypothetical protein ACYC1M_05170 [Armatimonadota bacterium]
MLNRPELSGGWEEVWRSLEMVEYFHIDIVVKYVKALGNATTAAKVGFFLQQHEVQLMVSASHLRSLKDMCPKSPHYMEPTTRGNGRFYSDWNLIVPAYIVERHWDDQ